MIGSKDSTENLGALRCSPAASETPIELLRLGPPPFKRPTLEEFEDAMCDSISSMTKEEIEALPKFHRYLDKDDDGIPLVKPVSCGRDGPEPIVINLPTLPEQAAKIAELLQGAHADGFAWGDMAVLCRDYAAIDACCAALRARKLPHQARKRSGDFKPGSDAVKVLTMKVSKGLEFPVVALAGVGQMPLAGEDEQDEARLFCVAATRATHRLIVGVCGDGTFGHRLGV